MRSTHKRKSLYLFAPLTLMAAIAFAASVALPAAFAQEQGAAPAPSQDAHAGHAAQGEAKNEDIKKAIAVLHPASGSKVSGTVTFEETDQGLHIVAHVEGLTPGSHGFHVHEWGDTSAPDGTSAGGHYNPTTHPHGAPTDKERHVGDLGNLEANDQGVAHLDWTDPVMKLDGPGSIIGRGVVVHEKADDLKSQPTGNAGGRIAVGVVGVANPNPEKKQ